VFVPIHFNCIEKKNGMNIQLNISFLFHRRKNITWIWNGMRVRD